MDSRASTICLERASSSRWRSRRWRSLGVKAVSPDGGSLTKPSECESEDSIIDIDRSRSASNDMVLDVFDQRPEQI